MVGDWIPTKKSFQENGHTGTMFCKKWKNELIILKPEEAIFYSNWEG